jgi:23S rRNA-/tRNA-specific pseudouridylate synthase
MNMLSYLAKQFFDRKTKRLYWAFVWGNLAEDSGTIKGHIGGIKKIECKWQFMKMKPRKTRCYSL